MLASKPDATGTVMSPGTGPGTMPGANARYRLAAATTEMMWVCALATARVTVASAARSLELWSRMLRFPSGPADPGAAALPAAPVSMTPATPAAFPVLPQAAASAAAAPAESTTIASYRSPGGHAAAQVTVSDAD